MSDSTRTLILDTAKAEFLEKGYEKASMRSIAGKLNMSAAALYWHFESKEALLEELVRPIVSAIHRYAESKEAEDYHLLANKPQVLDEIWNSDSPRFLLDLAYADMETARLLFCCSTGSRYQHFLDEIIEQNTEVSWKYLNRLRSEGYPVAEIDREELFFFMSYYYKSLLEPIRNGFSRERAEQFLAHHEQFFVAGWRAYLQI